MAEETPTRKTFTFEEARKLLPEVRARTAAAIETLREPQLTLQSDDLTAEEREELEEEARRILLLWAQDLIAKGLEVKGPFLVDFDSGGGYYCWRWPEERLEYFHGYSEGFAGRVRLQ